MTLGISRRRVLALGASAVSGALLGFPARNVFARVLSAQDVTLAPFGAAGDGEKDDTASIQRAIDEAGKQGGGTVILPPGRYLVSEPLRIDASGIQLIGTPGRTILTKKSPTRYIDVGGDHRLKQALALPVRERAATGSLSLQVRASATLPQDIWAVLIAERASANSDAERAPREREEYQEAQFIHIRSASREGLLELASPLRFECKPEAGTFKVIPVDWLTGCRISGISFDGVKFLAGRTPLDSNVLTMGWCMEPVIRTVEAWDLPNLFVSLNGCLRSDVSEVTARNTFSTGFEDSERGYGYVVVERGLNEGALISHIKAERVRHAYTTANMPLRIGAPFGSRISHSVAMATRGAGFDTHPIGESIAFVNCAVLGSLHAGFQLRSSSAQLLGCTAHDCQGPALQIHNTASDTQIIGFSSRHTGFGKFRKIDWSQRGAIVDRGTRTHINGAETRDCAGPGLELEHGGNDSIYRAVHVHNPCLAAESPSAGIRITGRSVTHFILDSCLVSSDARKLRVGFEISAPNATDGILRGCQARNVQQTIKVSSGAVRIIE